MRERVPSRNKPAATSERSSRRIAIELSWRSWWKLAAVVAAGWLWLRLWELVLMLVVAAIFAVALEPAVAWLERRRVGRGLATMILLLVIVGCLAGLLVLGWSSLSSQGTLLAQKVTSTWQEASARYPWLRQLAGGSRGGSESEIAGVGMRALQAFSHAAIVGVLAFILTAYLLVDGRRTWRWIRAYVPSRHHERFDATAEDVRREVAAYVAGNFATSAFATVFVLISLSLLHVPAALVLALLAGIFDFVPVLGFALSAAPAVLLALTKSTTTALVVVALYVAYHFVENYFIAPKIYGNRLKLSDVAVLIAFAAGAQLAGVIGALIALPIAAAYPAVERLWLQPYLARGTVREHERIEGDDSTGG